ncbi:MAG TPA: putative lipid II flippase FtsW [Alphaproteobacteria bacterium]|jgi:cell division protein FtsW|nr:putative lipid II flippase FtsW [Alphaproteobacteria bacterium]
MKGDKNLLILILTFVFIGLVAIADASAPQALSAYGDKFFFLKQQLMWAGIGLVVLFVISKIHYSLWEKVATPLFFISITLLILVLLPHFGFTALGARRWISFGPINFQPSELIKLSLCLYLAKVASKGKSALSYFIPLALIAGLIMLQPDLGTTLVVAIFALSQIFVSDINLLYFAGALGAGVLGTIGLILSSSYRKDRLLTFFEATKDPLGKSYHIRQILLALGSGGIFGVGLGASKQKYLFLPESSTDSIFAVIAEELGLIGSIVLILMFGYFIFKGLSIAIKAPDKFTKVAAVGISAWIGGQAFLNIASMIALVPLTGIPLPFVSYGGSSFIMVMTACGILLNISKYGKIEPKRKTH